MRVNLYFNEEDPKDKVIADFLNKRYSAKGFIKEQLYGMATGSALSVSNQQDIRVIEQPDDLHVEEYDEIKDINNIDM